MATGFRVEPSDRLVRRTDQLTASYLLTTAALVVVCRVHVPNWQLFVIAHVIATGMLFALRKAARGGPRLLSICGDWYPVVDFPVLYKEVEIFAAAFGNWDLTERIQAFEVSLFGGHPSLYLSDRLAWVPLSEYLHFCYLSYALVLPILGGYWYVTGRVSVFRELVLLLSATLFGSYLFFILFPVDSPFYLFEAPGEPLAGLFFYDLVHTVSAHGGARGGAFPSAHVSGSVVIWLVAWKRQRGIAYLLAPIVAGVVVATVYGRFHYAVDTIAGLAVAGMVVGGYRLLERGGLGPALMDEGR